MREVGEEARMISTCAHTKTRSSTSVVVPSPKRSESAFETGDELAGHAFRSSAISDACQRSSVVTMPAISARIRSASPRWLPSKRRGRWTLRMQSAVATPTSTSTAKTSTRSAYQPWCSSQPSGDPEASGVAVEDRRDRHEDRREQDEEAPEDERVDQARHEPLQQLALAEHDHRLVAHPGGHVSDVRSAGLPSRTSRESSRARRANSARPRSRRERDREGDARGELSAGLPPSAARRVIAGTISVRSPITA